MILLAVGLLLRVPTVAGDAPTHPPLTQNVRDQLVQEAGDGTLAPWQKEFMLEIARGESMGLGTDALTPVADLRTSEPTIDGTWIGLPPPTGRDGHTAVYDPMRQRMLVFGGYDGYELLGELWSLSLADEPAWSLMSADGSPPSRRYMHSAIYDPIRDRMVVFGGEDSDGLRNDVWSLDLSGFPTWSALTPAGVPQYTRLGHTAIYDPVRDRMVVFGGHGGSGAEVMALTLGGIPTWIDITPPGPSPLGRNGHAAIYDPLRDRMLIFGGTTDVNAYRNDVWSLSLSDSSWAQLTPAGMLPAPRTRQSAIYDPLRDRMVVFGGSNGGGPRDDVWALTLEGSPSWSSLSPAGPLPLARYGHSALYDPVGDRMLVFVGRSWGLYRHDTRALSLAATPTWSNPIPSSGNPPPAPSMHSAVYDPSRDRMVVFGGYDDTLDGFLNGVWALSLSGVPEWTQIVPAGESPLARGGHSAIYDPVRDRMVIFGGRHEGYYLQDSWALSFEGSPAWIPLDVMLPLPPPRWGHSAIYDPVRDRMVIYGGSDEFDRLGDVWSTTLEEGVSWSEVVPAGPTPAVRDFHSAIYDPVRDRMVVFGGGNSFNDVWTFSLSGTPVWSALPPTGTLPGQRHGHTAIYDPVRDRMVVFAGVSHISYFRDTWSLSLGESPAWTALVSGGRPPSARSQHTSIYDPLRDRMVILGGSARHDTWVLDWGTPLSVGNRSASPGWRFDMSQPRPNPSQTETIVEFDLFEPGAIIVEVFDVRGRRVKRMMDGWFAEGGHTVTWRGEDDRGQSVGAGVYFIRLKLGVSQNTRRIVRVP